VATNAIAAVVVAASGAGKYFSTQGISGSGGGTSSTCSTVAVTTGGIFGIDFNGTSFGGSGALYGGIGALGVSK
tara:strand:- start:904 stop:1125 length:222 start_codon:yes stop_codon:yes gene_type:complete